MDALPKRRLLFGALAILLVTVSAGLGYWVYLWNDPALAEAQRVFDQAMENGERPPREEMRQIMGGLTDAQRRAFFVRNGPRMREMITRRLTETLALPPEERKREIAARADRIIELRRSGDRPGERGPGERGPGGGRPPGGGPRGDWANKSQSERMKRVLDFTTPEMRGAFTELKRQVDEELAARGEPPIEGREMRRLFRER